LSLALIVSVAVALVVLRAIVYLLFEQLSFDSDQAINGLMAKHLSEGRALPLFFYGQTYMLAVEAWAAVPFFLIGGPTVAALRGSVLAWNVAFGLLLLRGFQRDVGLRPWAALVPALFFLAAPPSVSAPLISAQGGIIEPFVYIGLLWFLRRRPVWFGVVLAIGFRNREFTMYAVPVLLALDMVTGQFTRARLREWLIVVVLFFAVWESIEALKPFADLAGPGTRGQLLGGFSGSQVENLFERFNWQPGTLVERTTRMAPAIVAWLGGAAQVDTGLPIPDRPWLAWAAMVCLLATAGRVIALMLPVRRSVGDEATIPARDQIARAGFAWYLLGVGVTTVVMFVAGKPILPGYSRYALLGLLLPVGLMGILLAVEPRASVRRSAATVAIAWTALMAVDHARVVTGYIREPLPNPARVVADRLLAEQVPVASAGYWQAYVITFFARERVRVASNDFIRIQEYQDLFARQLTEARVLQDQPCPGGERVARWYLCKP
jgi:hypothetical protein